MKKKYFNLVVFLLLILSGCGSNTYPTVNPVSVEADTIQTKEIENTEIEITEKEEPKVAEPEEIEPEIAESEDEGVAEEEEPETKKLQYAMNGEKKVNELKPGNLLTKVTNDVREEYERRLEEGIVYEPETIVSDYTGYSDAEIIDIVNKRYLELHNEKRAELGVAPLTETDTMDNAATIRAEEISYFWSHTRPNEEMPESVIPWDGVTSFQRVGENIACSWNFEGSIEKSWTRWTNAEDFYKELADAGFDWLCNSTMGHYETLTNPEFKYIGIDSYIVRYKDFIIVYTAFEFASS